MSALAVNLACAIDRFPAFGEQVEQGAALGSVARLETGRKRGNPQDEADSFWHFRKGSHVPFSPSCLLLERPLGFPHFHYRFPNSTPQHG